MVALKLFSTILIIRIVDAFIKSVTLNNTHPGAPGIGAIITKKHVEIINNIWNINPQTQDGTDIELQMNKDWGFHPLKASTITLTIHGFTPNITKSDGEFLILFGVDTQYFSVVIRMEDNAAWKSYPDWNQSPLAITNNIYFDLIIVSTTNRWNKISNNDEWTNIGHPYLYKIGLKWPLFISITNDPIHNTVHYECILPERTLYVDFNTSFDINKGLSAYIMNDASDGKPFDIYSIDVAYSYSTVYPTSSTSFTSSTSSTSFISSTASASTSTTSSSPSTSTPSTSTSYTSSYSPVYTFDTTNSPSTVPTSITSSTIIQYDMEVHLESTFKDEILFKIKEEDNNTMYLVIIVILSVLLCVVTMILIYKEFHSKEISENSVSGDNINNRVPGAVMNTPLGEAVDQELPDEFNLDDSHENDSLWDSLEKIYANYNITQTPTKTPNAESEGSGETMKHQINEINEIKIISI